MRAIAVSVVVIYHAHRQWLSSGYVGVDIFFVISGFLIGGIIFREARNGTFGYLNFYARRTRRILPALVVVVMISLGLGLSLFTPSELRRLGVSAASAVGGVSNIRFWREQGYFQPDSALDPMLMTWSLGVEEQFYLLFPLILLSLRRASATTTSIVLGVLSTMSFLLAVVGASRFPTAAFYLLPTRAWELGLGAILAIWNTKCVGIPARAATALGSAGLVAILLSVLLFDDATPFPYAAMLATLGTTAVIASQGGVPDTRLLGSPPLVAIGRVSYSWYLWHWPLMAFVRNCAFGDPPLWAMLAVVPASLLLAAVSWRFVEEPFRHARRPAAETVRRYGLAVMLVGSVPIGVVLADGLPHRFSPGIARMAHQIAVVRDNPCKIDGFGDSKPNLGADCIGGAPHRPKIAIIGDSHAAALSPAVRRLAEDQGWGYVLVAKSSCRPSLGASMTKRGSPEFANACKRFNTFGIEYILRDPDVRTVLLAGLWPRHLNGDASEAFVLQDTQFRGRLSSSAFLEGLRRAITALRNGGKHVILVRDVPYWKADPVALVESRAMPLRHVAAELLVPDDVARTDAAPVIPPDLPLAQSMHTLALRTGAEEIRPMPSICEKDVCRFLDDGQMLYVDRSHLSPAGAMRALAPWRNVLFADDGAPRR